jgi:hypothetical protein
MMMTATTTSDSLFLSRRDFAERISISNNQQKRKKQNEKKKKNQKKQNKKPKNRKNCTYLEG